MTHTKAPIEKLTRNSSEWFDLTDKLIAWNDLQTPFWNLGVAAYRFGGETHGDNSNDEIVKKLGQQFVDCEADIFTDICVDHDFTTNDLMRSHKKPLYFYAETLFDLCADNRNKKIAEDHTKIARLSNKTYKNKAHAWYQKPLDQISIDESKLRIELFNKNIADQGLFLKNLPSKNDLLNDDPQIKLIYLKY